MFVLLTQTPAPPPCSGTTSRAWAAPPAGVFSRPALAPPAPGTRGSPTLWYKPLWAPCGWRPARGNTSPMLSQCPPRCPAPPLPCPSLWRTHTSPSPPGPPRAPPLPCLSPWRTDTSPCPATHLPAPGQQAWTSLWTRPLLTTPLPSCWAGRLSDVRSKVLPQPILRSRVLPQPILSKDVWSKALPQPILREYVRSRALPQPILRKNVWTRALP